MYNTLYKSGPLYSTEENVEQVQSLPRSLHKPSTTTASCSSEGGGDYCPGCHGHSTGVSSRVSAMWLLPNSKSHDFHNIIGGDSVQVHTLTHQISQPSTRFWQCQDMECHPAPSDNRIFNLYIFDEIRWASTASASRRALQELQAQGLPQSRRERGREIGTAPHFSPQQFQHPRHPHFRY